MSRRLKAVFACVAAFFVFALLLWLCGLARFSRKSSSSALTTDAAANHESHLPGLRTPSVESKSSVVTNPPPGPHLAATKVLGSPGDDGQISARALKQIVALEGDKRRRTPVQQKIASQLLYA